MPSIASGLLERNKRAIGKLIQSTVPTEKQYFEDYVCDDGLGMGPYRIKCSMWREGEKVIFDFDGTDPQSISSINFYRRAEGPLQEGNGPEGTESAGVPDLGDRVPAAEGAG